MINDMKNGHLTHNGGKIYYEDIGLGAPMVFIHGFTRDRRMWQHQVEFFKKTTG